MGNEFFLQGNEDENLTHLLRTCIPLMFFDSPFKIFMGNVKCKPK